MYRSPRVHPGFSIQEKLKIEKQNIFMVIGVEPF